MNKKKSLRIAAEQIFDKNSKRVSDCFKLSELKNISVIYVPQDAPRGVFEIAAFLTEQIKQKYPKTTPEIIRVEALFNRPSYSAEDLKAVFRTISNIRKHRRNIPGTEEVLLCRGREAEAMIRLLDKREDEQSQEFQSLAFLNVETYFREQMSAMSNIKGLKRDIETYEPYWYRYYVSANYLVVYASGFESWPRLVRAWHEIKRMYNFKPRILYVNDLPVSEKYAAKMYKRFSDFLYWMSVSYTEMTIVPSGEPGLVRDIIGKKSTIVFIPQLKTYLCETFRKKFSLSNVTFNIYKKSFWEYWLFSGPVSRQCICNELLNFMADWPTEKRNDFLKFFTPRTFGKWSLKLYWWNHKRGVRDFCHQIFLQNLGFYKKFPINRRF